MKRLMVAAAIAAMSAGLFAAEGDGAKQAAGEPGAQAAEQAVRRGRPAGAQFDRAKLEERMKKRQEERRAKVADVLKAAGLPEDKVGAAVDEIDKIYVRRPPQRPVGAGKRPQRRRPAGDPSAQQ